MLTARKIIHAVPRSVQARYDDYAGELLQDRAALRRTTMVDMARKEILPAVERLCPLRCSDSLLAKNMPPFPGLPAATRRDADFP